MSKKKILLIILLLQIILFSSCNKSDDGVINETNFSYSSEAKLKENFGKTLNFVIDEIESPNSIKANVLSCDIQEVNDSCIVRIFKSLFYKTGVPYFRHPRGYLVQVIMSNKTPCNIEIAKYTTKTNSNITGFLCENDVPDYGLPGSFSPRYYDFYLNADSLIFLRTGM